MSIDLFSLTKKSLTGVIICFIIALYHTEESMNMATSKERLEYIDNWKKENTDLIRIRVPKGKKEVYQDLANRSGAKSLTAYIISLLEDKLKEEL